MKEHEQDHWDNQSSHKYGRGISHVDPAIRREAIASAQYARRGIEFSPSKKYKEYLQETE